MSETAGFIVTTAWFSAYAIAVVVACVVWHGLCRVCEGLGLFVIEERED